MAAIAVENRKCNRFATKMVTFMRLWSVDFEGKLSEIIFINLGHNAAAHR